MTLVTGRVRLLPCLRPIAGRRALKGVPAVAPGDQTIPLAPADSRGDGTRCPPAYLVALGKKPDIRR